MLRPNDCTLITGANRGLGLEMVRQFAKAGFIVYAGYRSGSDTSALTTLAAEQDLSIRPIEIDVSNPDSISAACRTLQQGTDSLELLINNAAIMPVEDHLGFIDPETARQLLSTNSLGPLLVIQSFVPLLAAARQARVINISSHLGSIKNKRTATNLLYAASKAALNMITRSSSRELLDQGIIAISLNPGWVRTDLGGNDAPLSVQESVEAMRRFILKVKPRHHGGFFQRNGRRIPW